MNANMDAWKISEKDFPHNGSVSDKLVYAARYGMLSPSQYNTQPWLFEVKNETLYVLIDRRYGLPVVDANDRHIFTNCASTIFIIRVALKYFGYEASVKLMPDSSNNDLLASIKIGGSALPTEEEKSLFKSITKRHMNRGAYQPGNVEPKLLAELKAAAAKEGGWFHICNDAEKKYMVRMIIEADRAQTSNKRFKRELVNWIDPRRVLSGDGMPQLGLSHQEVMSGLGPVIARRFADTSGKVVSDENLMDETPVLAILGSTSSNLIERIYSGQAYARVLLTIQSLGLSASPLNHPLEVPEFRLGLHDELDIHGRAQVILRIGYAKKKPLVFPRRPVETMIMGSKGALTGGKSSGSAEKTGLASKISRLFLAKRA